MSLRRDAIDAYPGFPWLDAEDAKGVGEFLAARGWIEADERLAACTRAGEGNMNLTLRVRTDRRAMGVKQARPWGGEDDHIPAPGEGSPSEARFYESVARIPEVRGH